MLPVGTRMQCRDFLWAESDQKMDPKMDPKMVPFLGTVFEVPKSIDFGPKNRSIWRSKKETFWDPFIPKLWTRVPKGSKFPKPIRIRNGKRVEMKELVSMLEKVFEAQNGDARISSEICALSC